MTRSPRDLSPAIGSRASYRRAVIAGVFGWSFLLCSVLVFLALQGVRTLFLRLDIESSGPVVGYLSGQELAELVHHTSDLALSAVVVVDGWNDVYGPMLAATRFPANGLSAGFNWDVFQTLEHRLRLYTLGGATERGPNPPREPTADLQERIIDSYLANIRVLQQLCAARARTSP